ncbi:MAG: hypothetical protein ACLVJH_16625 [Faecalibacterium prausnitzii]
MNRIRRLRLRAVHAAVLCAFCLLLDRCCIGHAGRDGAGGGTAACAPTLSGDYGALQTALNDWLGRAPS